MMWSEKLTFILAGRMFYNQCCFTSGNKSKRKATIINFMVKKQKQKTNSKA